MEENLDCLEAPFFYEHSDNEPILFRGYKHPVLCLQGETIHQMLPITEFIGRLQAKASVRSCNNELEEAKYKRIEEHIKQDQEGNDPTYWKL